MKTRVDRRIEDIADSAAIVHYEDVRIPLHIKTFCVRAGEEATCIPHWHDDFELVHMTKGYMEYRINDDSLILSKGDCLFINTREMHYNRRCQDGDAVVQCVIFQPKILTANSDITRRYLDPIWIDNPLEYLYFPRNTEECTKLANIMDKLIQIREDGQPAYELEAIGLLAQASALIYREMKQINPAAQSISEVTDIEKKMVSFIYHRYYEKISLQDIADAGHVSVHRCCDIFKDFMDISPIEYLNLYRLEAAARLLVSTDLKILEIALQCGFDSPAYFSKLFHQRFNATPRQYRKQYAN